MLQEYIRLALLQERKKKKKLKKSKSKSATISAQSSSDMSQILTWLRLNKAIKSAGEIRSSGDTYIVRVKVSPKSSKSEIAELVKSRFGIFGRVR